MNPTQRRVVPKPKGLNCPNCGAAIELRAMGAAAAVACGYCGSTLDATNAQLTLLQRFKSKIRVEPVIPLGSRGVLHGTPWEAIGFQQRGIRVENVDYFWREYVLWNPYKGFRYLSEYDNHWNFVTPLQSLPEVGPQSATYQGVQYKHFQTADARTNFVLGEFPWQAQAGETVTATDYVSGDRMLSSEASKDEVNWSLGQYTPGEQIWTAFKLPGKAPEPKGIFANQPNPYLGQRKRAWKFFGIMAAVIFCLMIYFAVTARDEKVFEHAYTFSPGAPGEKSFVTEVFELKGRTSNVEIDVNADVDNSWLYLSMALINEETGEAYDFGREISYYHGVDEGESWSEGGKSDGTTLPSIPPGRYYLRVEPEADPAPGVGRLIPSIQAQAGGPPIRYTVRVMRDVPLFLRYMVAMLLLFIPMLFVGRKESRFESQRWAESGSSSGSSSGDSGDDDD